MFRHNIPSQQVILDRPPALKQRQPRGGSALFYGSVNSRRLVVVKRLVGSCLLLAIATLLLLMFGRAEAATPYPVSSAERSAQSAGDADVAAPQLMLKQQGQLTPALMLSSALQLEVSGMLVKATLSQHFRNTTAEWLEGVYLLPLPENAGVNRLTMQVGERLIEGEIKERQQAKQIFEQAKKSGKRASLLVQQRPNMFTNSVANIAPGEEVTVTVTYLQTLSYRDGEFELRFPMTITPRYSPGAPLQAYAEQPAEARIDLSGDLSWALPTSQVPDADKVSPFMFSQRALQQALLNPISITATIDPGMPLASLTSDSHAIVVSHGAGKYQLHLTAPEVAMDRDFILRWRPELKRAPQAALFTQQLDGEAYGLLMLMPPAAVKGDAALANASSGKTLAKEMIFVIDTSGSMAGEPIRQAKESLLMALSWLRPEDSFNLIQFNSATSMLFPAAMPASDGALQHARRYVQRLEAGGGTEMMSALQAALQIEEQNSSEPSRVRQVVFITDGAVSNEQALFKHIHDQLDDSRLFTVGIGAAPNSYFMRKAAEFGRGSYTYISNVEELQQPMSLLFKRLSSPVVDGIQLVWPADKTVDVYPRRIPTLYLDEPLLIAFKSDTLNGELLISGNTADMAWRRVLTLSAKADSPGISTLWARARIESLLDEKVAGGDADEIRQQVTEVALRHQLVSPYTSFVAVEKTPARLLSEVMKKVPVANVPPQGQAPQSFAVPKTATGAALSMLFGALFMLLAFGLLFALQRTKQLSAVRGIAARQEAGSC